MAKNQIEITLQAKILKIIIQTRRLFTLKFRVYSPGFIDREFLWDIEANTEMEADQINQLIEHLKAVNPDLQVQVAPHMAGFGVRAHGDVSGD
jgi:dynactin complex subunit